MSIDYLPDLLCHSTTVTLNTQWQNAHVLKMHTLQNRAWQQMNQIIKATVQCIHLMQVTDIYQKLSLTARNVPK